MFKITNSLSKPLTGLVAVYLKPRVQVKDEKLIMLPVIVLHNVADYEAQVLTTCKFPSFSMWQKSAPP